MSTATNHNVTCRRLSNTARITNSSSLTDGNIFCLWCTAACTNGNTIAASCCIIRRQHRRISHSTESQQSGDDGSYGHLTKIPIPVYICTYKFTLTGRFVLAFR